MKISRWTALAWIAISELFALSLWFSASAILPELTKVWNLNSSMQAWVTASVQIGFITGALSSSLFGIADRFNARKIFAVSALTGAVVNGLLVWVDSAWLGITLRFITGISMAGVYPIAVKLLSQWFPTKRGVAIGILVAALTLGSSLPHFIVLFLSSVHWQLVIATSSILALISTVIITWVLPDTPVASKKNPVSFKLLKKVVTNKPVMLANYGYFGHQWELYAMWTWLPAFLAASLITYSPQINPLWSKLFSFLSIGVAGAFGCIIGGYCAEKIGKSNLTIIAMSISALCSIIIGFTFGSSIWLTLIVSLIWGMTVVADSAQFSAAVTDFSNADYVGTALTFQMSIGFLITVFSINLVPVIQAQIGWEWVFAILSIGPILGIISMSHLKYYETSGKKEPYTLWF
ncbi:MFS transporter [Metallumcola ferriviriculae]|uniref:MFS transporter n=1 Tax=Metallumcola ferriviriculae TaxID=3039180 RepID=A0AAU0UTB7_9FIRM|nr:MFS transporter [Desulfitibacteraceae bacterium MK1]